LRVGAFDLKGNIELCDNRQIVQRTELGKVFRGGEIEVYGSEAGSNKSTRFDQKPLKEEEIGGRKRESNKKKKKDERTGGKENETGKYLLGRVGSCCC